MTAATPTSSPEDDWEGLTFAELRALSQQRRAELWADIPDWAERGTAVGGEPYARLVDALRDTRDAIADARLDEDACAYLSERLEEVTAYVRALRALPGERVWANRFDLAARGSPLPPALNELRIDPDHGRVRAQVSFGTSYAGAGDAAHGGAVALLLDELLGLASNAGRPPARTAYLHVDYRAIAPLNVPLIARARIDRVEGRKRWVTGELRRSDAPEQTVAEAEGLFVELRPWHA
ncbi:MAG: histidine phosphatase family protein [Actinobacteria bacterium]|nr:histidine phosphatase family protein [Actinomycetota bacterium]